MSDNGGHLRALIKSAEITQREAAEIISREAGEKIEERTVRRWLAEPSLPSARHCPGWAVRLLKIGLASKWTR